MPWKTAFQERRRRKKMLTGDELYLAESRFEKAVYRQYDHGEAGNYYCKGLRQLFGYHISQQLRIPAFYDGGKFFE
jgi:hypothetical protein